MREKKKAGIYTTHGEQKLVAMKAKVNGVLSIAYVKNNKLISYEPWEEVNRQMYSGPCLEFVTEK